ncbi:hypothetical protein SCLCIDRAFT_554816 [Scleroderma citrinum Foug A]|uniref:Uncharacterized protein n=1 Tax=Scleroderma citrinum Foug A TaxID=1036808 RepID=A0A0C2YRX0_9AGAM|nr:hypothetical protein SCLCIDRAFT_554816 [Scleroderma citrinum Foug A]
MSRTYAPSPRDRSENSRLSSHFFRQTIPFASGTYTGLWPGQIIARVRNPGKESAHEAIRAWEKGLERFTELKVREYHTMESFDNVFFATGISLLLGIIVKS